MTNRRSPDTLYDSPLEEIADFRFDGAVADVFADMINRSVPGYGALIALLPTLVSRFAQPNSRLYDLGCSLGAATLAMRHAVEVPGCQIIAIDNSEEMVKRARNNITRDHSSTPVEISCGDLRDCTIDDASVVVVNYTLQFLPPAQRTELLATIYQGLRTGGALILSEKICFEQHPDETLFTTLHHHYKRSMGYSDLAISQKRTALEGVLQPESEPCHRRRLAEVGFGSVSRWFQALNFTSYLALK